MELYKLGGKELEWANSWAIALCVLQLEWWKDKENTSSWASGVHFLPASDGAIATGLRRP